MPALSERKKSPSFTFRTENDILTERAGNSLTKTSFLMLDSTGKEENTAVYDLSEAYSEALEESAGISLMICIITHSFS